MLPAEFLHTTCDLMGQEFFDRLLSGLGEEPLTSIRINPFKAPAATPAIDAQPVPWCKNGFYLQERPNFTFDPLFHAGLYYVQEASSMFLDHVLRTLVHEPVSMLDLCAAPGGKTTCAMGALPKGSTLHSNEPIRSRAQILNENIQKFGHPDITFTNVYAKDYANAGMTFDVILTDVPCSGEGMFRKDSAAIKEWSPANVLKCQRLQREIVETIWPCLRPGGLLIYSTCTFNAHENEENVSWIAQELGADFVEIPTEEDWNIVGSLTDHNPVYRFLPGIARGEGLFMAVLRKKSHNPGSFPARREGKKPGSLNHRSSQNYQSNQSSPNLRSPQSTPPCVSVPYRDALAYLQGQSIVLPADTPHGIVNVCYQGIPLGQAKNLGNRANNLYPKPWRIRTTHLPKEETKIILI